MSDPSNLDLFGDDGREEESEAAKPAAPPEEPRVWSVSQVNRAVRSLLESTVDALWVRGEIGNWTRSRAGHCYFTLKDEQAQLRCVLWRSDAERLPADPEDGMEVRVFGTLTLYEARGEYQMAVRRLEAEGEEGLWRIAFEKVRRRLEGEGLLDPAGRRPLPRFPTVVGVVTSPTGAAIRDILTVLRRRAPWVRVVVRGARVQGDGAAQDIAAAVEELGRSGLCDVLIVGRGGGSVEDLWAFNEEIVARAVAASPVPVVSAVGHEVDVTISDLVADLRAPTPSAGAEAVTPDRSAVVEQLQGVPERLARGLRGTVERRRVRAREALHRLARNVERRIAPMRQAVDRGAQRLEGGMTRLLEGHRSTLRTLSGRLQALSPLSILERGYSVARGDDGRVLGRVEDFSPGRSFNLRVVDGSVACEARGPLEEEDQ